MQLAEVMEDLKSSDSPSFIHPSIRPLTHIPSFLPPNQLSRISYLFVCLYVCLSVVCLSVCLSLKATQQYKLKIKRNINNSHSWTRNVCNLFQVIEERTSSIATKSWNLLSLRCFVIFHPGFFPVSKGAVIW